MEARRGLEILRLETYKYQFMLCYNPGDEPGFFVLFQIIFLTERIFIM